MSSYFVEFTSSVKSVELHWTEPGGRSDFKSLLIDDEFFIFQCFCTRTTEMNLRKKRKLKKKMNNHPESMDGIGIE